MITLGNNYKGFQVSVNAMCWLGYSSPAKSVPLNLFSVKCVFFFDDFGHSYFQSKWFVLIYCHLLLTFEDTRK